MPMMQDAYFRALEVVADEFGTTVDGILSDDRKKGVTCARHAACTVFRRRFRLSYPEIGKIVGRDHTTAMAGVKRFAVLEEEDEFCRMAMARTMERVKIQKRKRIMTECQVRGVMRCWGYGEVMI